MKLGSQAIALRPGSGIRNSNVGQTIGAPIPSGIELFLGKHCTAPAVLRRVFEGFPRRVQQFRDGDVICNAGDEATELWLVLKGRVRIESDTGALLVTRDVGELVGEQAYLRAAGQLGRSVRGTRMRALGSTELQIIDFAYLEALSDPERVVWAETMNRVLSAKLDEATVNRADLHHDNRIADSLVSRFVCDDGLHAARASLSSGIIDPERCDCIIWFSDVAGFSKYALELAPAESGMLVHELMDIQASAIARAGGQIDKFMGDGLMAFWRVPDNSRKGRFANAATQAAIQSVKDLTKLFRERQLPLDVRVGLHIGPVILGDFGGGGRIAFTCIGQAVNAASRYEQALKRVDGAPLGRVRVSPNLWSLVTDKAITARFDDSPGEFADKHGVRYPVHSLRR